MSAAGAEYWDTLPLGRGVRLVTRDENGMAALAKPAGALSHPNSAKGEARALLRRSSAGSDDPFEISREIPDRRIDLG